MAAAMARTFWFGERLIAWENGPHVTRSIASERRRPHLHLPQYLRRILPSFFCLIYPVFLSFQRTPD